MVLLALVALIWVAVSLLALGICASAGRRIDRVAPPVADSRDDRRTRSLRAA